jgi:23S rRNA pseudouridine1911/1915/1917 synthase
LHFTSTTPVDMRELIVELCAQGQDASVMALL